MDSYDVSAFGILATIDAEEREKEEAKQKSEAALERQRREMGG